MTGFWGRLFEENRVWLIGAILAGCTHQSVLGDSGESDLGHLDSGGVDSGSFDGAFRDNVNDVIDDAPVEVQQSDGGLEDRAPTLNDAAVDVVASSDVSLDATPDAAVTPFTALVQVDLLDREDLSAGSTQGLGDCLEVSADGQWMVTARSYFNGRFLVFRRTPAGWSVSYEIEARDFPGFPTGAAWPTCSINDDGSVVSVGNYDNEQGSPERGATYVLVRDGESWRLAARVSTSDDSTIGGVGDLSGDGSRLVAVSSAGQMFVFSTPDRWNSWSRELVASNTARQNKFMLSTVGAELYSGAHGAIYRRSPTGLWSSVSSAPRSGTASRDLSRLIACGSASQIDLRFARCVVYVRGLSSYTRETEVLVDVSGRAIPGNYWVHVDSEVRNDGRWTLLAYDHDQHGHALFYGTGSAYERADALGTSPNALGTVALSEGGWLTVYSHANPWVIRTLDAQ